MAGPTGAQADDATFARPRPPPATVRPVKERPLWSQGNMVAVKPSFPTTVQGASSAHARPPRAHEHDTN